MAITSGQDDDPEALAETGEGYVAYELHAWARESRLMLQQLLEGAEIPYAWEGTDLVAPGVFEARIDDLVDQVDATTIEALDPDAEKILYELGDWSDAECTQVAQVLADAGIAYEFDVDGCLLVLADDEEAVERLLDQVEFPDALDPEAPRPDEPDAQAVLTKVFLASDRLRHDAHDHAGVLGVVEGATTLGEMRLPFGFEPTTWKALRELSAKVRDLLEADDSTDDEIEEQAGLLRDLLRELV